MPMTFSRGTRTLVRPSSFCRRTALAHLFLVLADDKTFGVAVHHETGRAFLRAGIEAEDAGYMAVVIHILAPLTS